MANITKFTAQILQFISEDKLKTAIKEIQILVKGSSLYYEAILQSARYNDVIRSIQQGTIAFDKATLEKNKIRFALLDMIRELEESAENNESLKVEVEDFLQQHSISNQASIEGNNNTIIQGITGNQIHIRTNKSV